APVERTRHMSPSPTVVGRLRRIWRYPVKSLAAEALSETAVGWHGVAGDRRWAFVRPDSQSRRFPWQTIRENALMCRFRPEFDDPARPDDSKITVHAPDGQSYAVDDPALADRIGVGTRLMRVKNGVFDEMPLSLISTATVAELCRRASVPADALRFRPNLLVEPVDDRPFVEDEWVGATLRIGATELRVDQRDPRCVMINTDPVTAERDPAVLRSLADRNGHAGVYGTPVTPGTIHLEADVVLL
ncbi:MOSC domain-containing protein, partial [Streptomyces alkaliterrae]